MLEYDQHLDDIRFMPIRRICAKASAGPYTPLNIRLPIRHAAEFSCKCVCYTGNNGEVTAMLHPEVNRVIVFCTGCRLNPQGVVGHFYLDTLECINVRPNKSL